MKKKPTEPKKRVAIIDGDSLCFRAAAAAEERKVQVKHLPSARIKIFKTRTEFKAGLEAKNFEYVEEDYLFTDLQEPEPIENALALVKSQISKIERLIEPDEFQFYIAGGDNFRNFLALPTPYKPRGGLMRPIWLLKCRDYLVKQYGAVDVSDTMLETDDVITIKSYEEQAKGNWPIMCSLDKDSNQSDGICLFDWTKEDPQEKVMPLIGSLYKDKNKMVKGEGLMFLCYQWLAGDSTDGYCSYDLSKVKYGPTKAMNALIDCKTAQELYDAVVAEYKKLYPEPFEYTAWNGLIIKADYSQQMDLYWQCCYMKRYFGDLSDYKEFWSKKGVTNAL